jgi:hypothetical protein
MSPTKRRLIIILATLLLVALVPAAVMAAGGRFTDDDESIFEDDIEWLADAGVTLGCNPPTNDLFCPTANVTREQMAAFMRRFAEYLGAEDGTVTSADNASTLDGLDSKEFQPARFGFEGDQDVTVVANTNYEIASASVTTSAGSFCVLGSSPKADILVRATGYTDGIGAGDDARLYLTANGTTIGGTIRDVEDNDAPFAMEWLFVGDGGIEEFALYVSEFQTDYPYSILNAQITVEVIQDTRCEFTVITLP